jgi:hypothetical protein
MLFRRATYRTIDERFFVWANEENQRTCIRKRVLPLWCSRSHTFLSKFVKDYEMLSNNVDEENLENALKIVVSFFINKGISEFIQTSVSKIKYLKDCAFQEFPNPHE